MGDGSQCCVKCRSLLVTHTRTYRGTNSYYWMRPPRLLYQCEMWVRWWQRRRRPHWVHLIMSCYLDINIYIYRMYIMYIEYVSLSRNTVSGGGGWWCCGWCVPANDSRGGHDVVVPVLCARAAPREARLRTNNARFPNPRFYRYIAMIHTRVGGGLDQRR